MSVVVGNILDCVPLMTSIGAKPLKLSRKSFSLIGFEFVMRSVALLPESLSSVKTCAALTDQACPRMQITAVDSFMRRYVIDSSS